MNDGLNSVKSEEDIGMDIFREKVTQDINDLRQNQNRINTESSKMKDDIRDLQISDKLQDQEISGLKATLSEIKDDTNWIRRRITGAVITAVITALIGGLVAIAITFIYG